MRVLVVHNYYSSRVPSGENLSVHDEISWLRDAGVDVHTHEVSNDTGVAVEGLGKLRPAFKKDGTVTAGNASSLNDGAAAVLVCSASKAQELGLTPIATIRAHASAGVDPAIMGTGPIPASQRCLQRAGWTVDDLDLIEANEAFAAQAISVSRDLGWDTSKAGSIYAVYTAMVYLLALPGGWIADRLLGARKSVFWGGLVIMMGHIVLTFPGVNSFYGGLVLVCLGTGLLKPNISVIVGQLYATEDERRDSGYSLYYMGINIGGFLAPLVTGYLAQSAGWRTRLTEWGIDPASSWHWGFGAAAIGMALGLIWFVVDSRSMGQAGMEPAPVADQAERTALKRKFWISLGGVLVFLAALAAAAITGVIQFTAEGVSRIFGVGLLLVVLLFFGWLFLANKWTVEERKRLLVITVLFWGAVVFWSVFEQTGSTLNLFAQRSTDNTIMGRAFPASWWQSVNSAWIILLAPVFAWIWFKLGRRDPSSPAKFTLGLFFVGLSFLWMVPAASMAANGQSVGWWWLLVCYLLQTIGELCLSPVGLSAMTRLAPQRVVSLMMGVWFMATAVGSFLGGTVSSFYESFELPSLFGVVGVYGLVFAAVLALLIKPIKRMMAREG